MTARAVYERALAFINERDGKGTFQSDIQDFEKNAPEVINSCVTLLLYDESIIEKKPIRELEEKLEAVTALDSEVPLHISLCSGVLPYLLASMLIAEEDKERADYFYNLFKDSENRMVKSYSSAHHTKVRDVYGGNRSGEELC